MADQSFEEKVAELRMMSGHELDEAKAAKYLRFYNNDMNTAINHYFDGDKAALQDDGWDNSAWTSDRYGEQDDSSLPAFRIDYAPGVTNYPHSGAPSRPPSRTSHHSGTSNTLTNQTVAGTVEQGTGQESGVIGGTNPYFGPATKEHYDSNQWALVPASTATEVFPDPNPSERKREVGGPAILKPLPSGDYLPALLTILHSVPLFRNAFLAPHKALNYYGVNTEWWKGSSSANSQTVVYGTEEGGPDGLDLIFETQRLMAFLDSTDRAYGSVESLLSLDDFSKGVEALDIASAPDFHKFLMVWARAFETNIPSADLNGVIRSRVMAGGESVESWYLDATAIHNDPTKQPTIYDVLDYHLFSSPTNIAFVTEISNVLILKLSRSDRNSTGLDVTIPATFYADRYLEKNSSKIKETLKEMKEYEDQISEINRKSEKYRVHIIKKDGRKIDSLVLLRSAMSAFQPLEDGTFRRPKDEINLRILERAYATVEQKIQLFDEQKKKLQEVLDNISNAYKAPMDDNAGGDMDTSDGESSVPKSQIDFTHAYRLRGVSTRPSVMYLLHPDISSNVPGDMQWWRVEFCSYENTGSYILREKVTLETVLEKASAENTEALLVYANDAAINMDPVPLSKPLQDFVKRDNLNFLEEIQNETIGTAVIGDWDNVNADDNPPNYGEFDNNDDFKHISAAEFNRRQAERYDEPSNSAFSSTTLTPNTEIGDDGRDVEMREVAPGTAFYNTMPIPMTGISGGRTDDEVVDVILSPEMEPDSEDAKKESDEIEKQKSVRKRLPSREQRGGYFDIPIRGSKPEGRGVEEKRGGELQQQVADEDEEEDEEDGGIELPGGWK